MCRDVVGEILYFLPNHLNWKIPQFSDLIPKSGSRIWSPKFGYYNESMKFDPASPKSEPFAAKTNLLKLIITIKNGDCNPINWVRVGVTDETGTAIDTFKCVWYHSSRLFCGFSWLEEKELSLRREGKIPNGHLRFFCQINSMYFKQVPTPATQQIQNVTNAPTSSTSASKSVPSASKSVPSASKSVPSASMSVNSNISSWICEICFVTNPTNDLNCMACKNRKSKNMDSAVATSPITSNSTNISAISSGGSWDCNICRSKNQASESTCMSCTAPKSKRMKNQSLDQLSQTFKALFTDKKDTDLTIKVQGQEFSVHRLVLRARSSEFDTMLSNMQQNTKITTTKKKKTTKKKEENNENVIVIEDCEPRVFEEFLLFIYSGKTENMTCDNVSGLYYAADKYNLPDLKCECIDFLKKYLSLENIFEAVDLATKHNESELLNLAINYFAENMDEILTTSKWMLFLKDNPIVANELCIKALRLGFTKKDDFVH